MIASEKFNLELVGERIMTITRRSFLRDGTLVGLSTVAALSLSKLSFAQSAGTKSGTTAIPREVFATPLYNLSRATCVELVYTKFSFTSAKHGTVETYLKSVEDLTPAIFKTKAKSGLECFNLVFACQSDIELEQGTYTVTHAKLGTFDLFVVPGAKQRYGRDYNAVINHLFP
jgi:hypothetical protein